MWQYRILETGFFLADGGAMFGAIPKRAWKRRYPCNEDNCCILAMNCILLWNEERIILFDTGIGTKDLGKLSYYCFFNNNNIVDLVREEGFNPENVTDVILSHLHFDHCGGCTYLNDNNNLRLSFPNAIHHVSKSQWENYLNPNILEKDSFRKEDLIPVQQAGLLHLVEENIELFPNLFLDILDGHTWGQLLLSFIYKDELIVCPSDVIPTKAHLSAEWISAYDICPLESLNAKILLKERIKDKKTTFVFYHDTYKKSFQYILKI